MMKGEEPTAEAMVKAIKHGKVPSAEALSSITDEVGDVGRSIHVATHDKLCGCQCQIPSAEKLTAAILIEVSDGLCDLTLPPCGK